MERQRSTGIAVVGGGLAGLAAAAAAARAGAQVTLFEKAGEVGGRATTQRRDGFAFNVGPHALYCTGHGMGVLRELGVAPRGARPPVSGAFAIHRGRRHALPGGLMSLLTTGLLSLPGKLEVGKLLGSLPRLDTSPLQGLPVAEGLARIARRAEVRELLAALIRVSTYANAPDLQSAGAALDQLKAALGGGVLYLDDGWQTLVEGLRSAATAAGAAIAPGVRVDRIATDEGGVALSLADGATCRAHAVILAIAPDEVRDLLPPAARATAARWAEEAIPVRAACLDVALSHLPDLRAGFALGIDRPLYLSVHSKAARLAPPGGALIHVAKYLDPSRASDASADELELEGLLDRMQPGWRGAVVHRRFLPRMTVANAVATAQAGGLRGRPGPAIPDLAEVFVAGDWVGPQGMLADASLASARDAAALATHVAAKRGGRAAA